MISEAIRSNRYLPLLNKIYRTVDFPDTELIEKHNVLNLPVEVISRRFIQKIADSKNPQGIFAHLSIPEKPGLLKEPVIIALDRINDPGNLGTIIRTAYWFNIKSIIISGNSADVYNPKVLRSSQGAVFHVNIHRSDNLLKDLVTLKNVGYSVYISTPHSHNILSHLHISDKCIFTFGNESHGVNNEIKAETGFTNYKIQSYSNCESLNVAAATAITLYELKKNSF